MINMYLTKTVMYWIYPPYPAQVDSARGRNRRFCWTRYLDKPGFQSPGCHESRMAKWFHRTWTELKTQITFMLGNLCK